MASGVGKVYPSTGGDTKGRKRKFLPHGKPVRKGAYPLRPGVQGFFITCDGGRERDATREALSLLDSFYEDLVDGKVSYQKSKSIPDKPMNKKITFEDSDSSDDEEEDHSVEEASNGNNAEKSKATPSDQQVELFHISETASNDNEEQVETADGSAPKKQCVEDPSVSKESTDKPNESADIPKESTDKPKDSIDKPKESTDKPNESADKPKESTDKPKDSIDKPKESTDEPKESSDNPKESIDVPKQPTDKPKESTDKPKESTDKPKDIDDLIDEDLKQLGDRKKRLFASVDSGCNGCIFIQMQKRDGDPGPVEIVQNMMSSAASTRKHMSRFILRILPAEVACYASEEEITRAVSPLIEKYFPKESSSGHKFAVLYEARSNTGIDRMKIINAVAKSVPQPHKVDLSKPDKTIIVQIAKTICLIGVVEKYKELAKFNLRQLTSPPEK